MATQGDQLCDRLVFTRIKLSLFIFIHLIVGVKPVNPWVISDAPTLTTEPRYGVLGMGGNHAPRKALPHHPHDG